MKKNTKQKKRKNIYQLYVYSVILPVLRNEKNKIKFSYKHSQESSNSLDSLETFENTKLLPNIVILFSKHHLSIHPSIFYYYAIE